MMTSAVLLFSEIMQHLPMQIMNAKGKRYPWADPDAKTTAIQLGKNIQKGRGYCSFGFQIPYYSRCHKKPSL